LTYSYGEVGATRSVESMPRDAHWVVERRLVGGPSAFDPAADFVLGFGMQRAGGFRVTASSPTAVVGTSLTLRRWFGPVRITARTQVVYVVDEPARRGFAYGTLPGHPESGEELRGRPVPTWTGWLGSVGERPAGGLRHANVAGGAEVPITGPSSHIRMSNAPQATPDRTYRLGSGVVMPASASAATISSRLMPSR
jgi:hypothetical protein